MSFSAGHAVGQQMWTTRDIFSGVYKDSTSAIMVTLLREEEENGKKLFHNTAGTVYPGKPDLIHRNLLHQNRSFKLKTTALVSVFAAETQPLICFLLCCCFICSLIWSALHVIFFHYTFHDSPPEHLSENCNRLLEQLINLIESQGYERWSESCKLFNSLKQNQEKFEENL